MKYSIAKTKHPELNKVNELWTKKFSEIHINGGPWTAETKCGLPMLGNNYSEQAVQEDREVCSSCLSHLKFGEPHTAEGDSKQTEVKKPIVNLIGKDGNVFNLIGAASSALLNAGMEVSSEEIVQRCMGASSYDEVLNIICEYCDVR